MAQISRKELKSDEFVSGMDAAYEFYLQHQKAIATTLVVIAVVVACGYGIFAWRRSRNQRAAAMLAQALNTLHAPLQSAGLPAGTSAYATAAARGTVAAQQFQSVIDNYGSTGAGQLAHYYLGLAELDVNTSASLKKAAADLHAASHSSDATVATAAKHALANLAIQNGNFAQAHALLLALTQQDSATLPRAVALLELADLDRTYNPKEAALYYQQLETQYPNTSTAQQAEQDLASLKH
ncbi:MAG: tetratricopeptide repeat protein [Terriglobales bacterium]